MVSDPYFVDKSLLIQELLPALGKKNRFSCITRPCRFGKTLTLDMTEKFYSVKYLHLRQLHIIQHLLIHIYQRFLRTPPQAR